MVFWLNILHGKDFMMFGSNEMKNMVVMELWKEDGGDEVVV
jgi:hypothetical protein